MPLFPLENIAIFHKMASLWLSWLKICLQWGRPRFDSWVGKIPWRRERLPIPVFLPGEFHGVTKSWTWLSSRSSIYLVFIGKVSIRTKWVKWKCLKVKVTQLCLTLCNPMDYTVHGILQARILEWVAFPFSRGSSQPRDQSQVSRIAGRFFTSWATREALAPDHQATLSPTGHPCHMCLLSLSCTGHLSIPQFTVCLPILETFTFYSLCCIASSLY